MLNIPQKKNLEGNIQDSSILRQFTVLFLLMAVIPTLLLFVFYLQIQTAGQNVDVKLSDWFAINLTPMQFNTTLILVVIGVLVGFSAMTSILKKLIDLTNANRKALEDILSPEKIEELSGEKNEIAILAQSFSAITSRLEENVRSLEIAKKTLHNIMKKVGQGISGMENIDSFLELIVETVTDALNGKTGVLMLLDENRKELSIKTVYGVDYEIDKDKKIKIDKGTMLKQVIDSKKPMDLPMMFSEFEDSKEHKGLFDPPLMCVPLIIKEKAIGILIISGRKNLENYSEEEKNLLFTLATQTAVAIENSRLNADIEKTYFETISALALAVDAKDTYSRGHLERVATYCVQIANRLGLDEEDVTTLHDAAMLHDLGKIGIPDNVLRKPYELNDQEWLLMRKHPEIGESIIKPIRSLQRLCDIIRHHHEFLDGTGYPDNLKGDDIAALVRITTVADIYDALTTNRSYRDKVQRRKATDVLRSMKDQIDQDIVEVFIEILEENNPSYY